MSNPIETFKQDVEEFCKEVKEKSAIIINKFMRAAEQEEIHYPYMKLARDLGWYEYSHGICSEPHYTRIRLQSKKTLETKEFLVFSEVGDATAYNLAAKQLIKELVCGKITP